MRKKYTVKLNNRELQLGDKTLIMGILNVTPDSFSDGGKYADAKYAVKHGLEMIEQGADIIDIGGESTRPGSTPVAEEEELGRVIPVIEGIRKESDIPISIDTYKAKVAMESIFAGADMINDISGCRFDPEMASVATNANIPVTIMHIKGTPRNMQENPTYDDIIKEIKQYLAESIDFLKKAGVHEGQILIDPGIGFGKSTEDNLTIMNRLDEFASLGHPILVGVSRKSVIGNILELPIEERIFGTAAAVTANIMKGSHVVRVHDVAEMRQVVKMADAIVNSNQ